MMASLHTAAFLIFERAAFQGHPRRGHDDDERRDEEAKADVLRLTAHLHGDGDGDGSGAGVVDAQYQGLPRQVEAAIAFAALKEEQHSSVAQCFVPVPRRARHHVP
jgi:hypothetical protein